MTPSATTATVDAYSIPARGDVGRAEMTRDPIFLLRIRAKNRPGDSDRWKVESVWFTREEAEAFAASHVHRWLDDRYGRRWQVYCTCAEGKLAALLKAVTIRASTPSAQGGGV